MEFKLHKLFVFCIILLSCTCVSEEPKNLIECDLENAVNSISDSNGTIWFESQVQSHVIFSGVEGTFDGQNIWVVCNLPEGYKEEGLKVIFSGKYSENIKLVPQIPGQQYFNLELTKIDLVQED